MNFLRNLLICALMLSGGWFIASYLKLTYKDASGWLPEKVKKELRSEQNQMQFQYAPTQGGMVATEGGLTLTADNKGHYRGKGTINGITMPFMIDTGATDVAIPEEMAKEANLPIGEIKRLSTANGDIMAMTTNISELKIGNATLKNVKATVNNSIDEILMGMSAIKHFKVEINGKTMKMVSKGWNGREGIPKWKKTVSCNEEKTDCRTTYGE